MKPVLAISTCWNSHRHEDGYAMLAELASLGFEAVELGHGIRFSLWPGILKAHEEKLIRIQSLHNFCPLPMGFMKAAPNCYEFSDPRPSQRKQALKYSLDTINHAAAFGAQAVVLHLGTTCQKPASRQLERMLVKGKLGSRRYVQAKLDSVIDHERWFLAQWPWVEEILFQLAGLAASKNIQLGLECRESIEEIPIENKWPAILSKFGTHVGYWHDFGHAQRKHNLNFTDHTQQLETLAPRLIGCHIHDVKAPLRDHQAPGTGCIPYAELWPIIKKAAVQPLYVLELSPRVEQESVKDSLVWWKQNGPA